MWVQVVLPSVLIVCLQTALVHTETRADVADWKKILGTYMKWEGSYNYLSEVHHCQMIVHSVQLSPSGGMIATFKDEQAVLEIQGFSGTEDMVIDISKITTYNSSDVFPRNRGFKARLKLRLGHDRWILSGNVSEPEGFHVLYLDAISSHNTAVELDDGQKASRIGLSVGIPLALAVILSVVAVSMVVWALKKGYIRRRPGNYKNFSNDVSMNERNPQPAHENRESQSSDSNHINLGPISNSLHI